MDKYAVFPLMKYKLLLIRHFEQPTAFFCIRFFSKYYSKMLSTEKTAAVVTIIQINPDSIRIVDRAKEQVTVYGQEEDLQALQVTKNYFIVYESRWFTRPTLVSIEPMPDDVCLRRDKQAWSPGRGIS